MMKIRKEWSHNQCPQCLMNNKTNKHVLLCQDPWALLHWDTLTVKLDKDLQDMTTVPMIWQMSISKLHNTGGNDNTTQYRSPANTESTMRQLHKTELVGLTSCLVDCQVNEQLLNRTISIISEEKRGKRWFIAIMTKLLNIPWDMWDHRNGILYRQDHPWKSL